MGKFLKELITVVRIVRSDISIPNMSNLNKKPYNFCMYTPVPCHVGRVLDGSYFIMVL